MLFELLSRHAWAASALGVVLLFIYLRKRPSRLPKIPIIGARKGDWFPLLQARWRNTKDFHTALQTAYTEHRDSTVLVPVASVEGNIVLLPPSEIQWLADQPETAVGFNERVFELYQTDYTFMDPTIPRATLHDSLLRTALTPQLPNLIPELADEVSWAFGKYWGDDESEWRDIPVFETMRHIIGGVANRAFVGLPLCRDPTLVNNAMAFAQDLPLSGVVMNLFWKPLRPLVAPLVTIPNRLHTNRFRKSLASEITRRLHDYEAREADPEDKSIPPEPNDFLQWSIHQAKSIGNSYLWRKEALADSMLIVNFAAIHTTSFASTWALFDLVSSPPEILDELREEITTVLAAHGGKFTKRALAELVKLDSAIRESTRLSSMLTVGLGRLVMAEDGVITPSGVRLPKGSYLSVPSYTVMRDEAVYSDARTYVPFRFSTHRNNQDNDDSAKRTPNALPVTTPEFLIFGHGKHACPGRFFAAVELKLVFAHALMQYDFEHMAVKPEGPWFGVTRLPPMKATIRVKKRKSLGS